MKTLRVTYTTVLGTNIVIYNVAKIVKIRQVPNKGVEILAEGDIRFDEYVETLEDVEQQLQRGE